MKKKRWFAAAMAAVCLMAAGCSQDKDEKKVPLDPNNPVTVTIWHYYNGAQKNAFDALTEEFNKTVGREQGIIVQAVNHGNVSDLTKSIVESAQSKVGSDPIPNIFAAYADTAYQIDKMDLVADLGQYLTDEELAEYFPSYLEEGRIGQDGKLKIFPTAKSTEVFMLNKTDWEPFAEATGADVSTLSTIEGVTAVAKQYYAWSKGKAFFGRDAVANYFIIGCRQFGTEIFEVKDGKVTFQLKEELLRKLWDNYYVPFMHGYFAANGKFRSDDAKIGDILALVGSSTTASYFPTSVIADDKNSYPIEALVLPAPRFEGGEAIAVQQGAGMVVTKTTKEQEYASVQFLKWFTEADRNLEFSISSGYLPVKKEANTKEKLAAAIDKLEDGAISDNMKNCLQVSLETVNTCTLYTNKAFDGGTEARAVLENTFGKLLEADLAQVDTLMKTGAARETAVAGFTTDEHFKKWCADLKQELEGSIQSKS